MDHCAFSFVKMNVVFTHFSIYSSSYMSVKRLSVNKKEEGVCRTSNTFTSRQEAEEEPRIDGSTCTLRTSQVKQKHRGGKSKKQHQQQQQKKSISGTGGVKPGVSAGAAHRFHFISQSGSNRERHVCPRRHENTAGIAELIDKSRPQAYVSLLNMHPLRFFPPPLPPAAVPAPLCLIIRAAGHAPSPPINCGKH